MADAGALPGRRIVFDLTSAARWTGPPVGVIRAQRELAAWARRELPGARFALFDPRTMAYRAAADAWIDPIIGGEASIDAWALPEATGARARRSAAIPAPLYAALQARRTMLRLLEHSRLASPASLGARLAGWAQRPLITARYAPAMLGPDGSRRAFLPPKLAFGPALELQASDILVCTGFGWSHSNVEAVQEAKERAGFALAVMCYDIIPLMFPHFFKTRDVTDMRRYWDSAFAAAELVVVNAEAVARDVRGYCADHGVAPRRLAVSPLGADPSAMRGGDHAALPAGLEPDRYALFVSTIEPRKGHDMLLRAWLALLDEGVPQRRGFKLALVGRSGWMTEAVQRTLAGDDRLSGSLALLQGLGDVALDALYRNAAFCLYPSLYEGYGLPLVEAFARGKAVLASSGGALAETAAGFSPTLDPGDEAAWRSALKAWIEHPEERAPYEQAIRERYSHPTWNEAAARFFAAIAAIATSETPPSPSPTEENSRNLEPSMTAEAENTLIMKLAAGPVAIRMRPDLAPAHVRRIKELAREGFYDGLTFHRVIPGFMAQGGDPTGTGRGGSGRSDVPAEFSGEKHLRGVCSMARTADPNSANCQFFICFADAAYLDGKYTVWGEVIEGMECVDALPAGEPPSQPGQIISMRLATDA